MNDLATRVIELTPNGVISFLGNYDEFLYYKNQILPQSIAAEKKNQPSAAERKLVAHDFEKTKQISAIERKIAQLDKKIQEQETAFADLRYGTPEYKKAEEMLKKLQAEHVQCMKEWELLIY